MNNNKRTLSQIFYELRSAFWNYPDKLFTGKDSLVQSFKRFYEGSSLISVILLSTVIGIILIYLVTTSIEAQILRKDNIFIEGIVMGVDEQGQILKINRINPLLNSNVQLEKDLSEIIYSRLIKIDQEGNAKPELADFFTIEKGKRYQFRLKSDLYWSDGVKITSEDVLKTFELIQTLETRASTSSLYSKAANKVDIVKSLDDDRTFEFVVKGDNVIPGFFEAISFKILPAHLISDMNVDNITNSEPVLNRFPVGSGPYKLSAVGDNFVELVVNEFYTGKKPSIQTLRLKLFASELIAYNSLISGQIHGLSGLSDSYIKDISNYTNVDKIVSDTIYNQYWALYFNLNENSPKVFKELKFRQAVNMAINKDQIIQNANGLVEEAKGPIPPSSFAYFSTPKVSYNIDMAKQLLTDLGYIPNETTGTRIKGTDNLSFELVLINNKDREYLAGEIKNDLAKIGIEINVHSMDLATVVDQYIIPRNYQMLLYGVQTFIDPDRYELFHSSQIEHPGLNIAGYISADKRTQVVGGKTTKVASVDDDLADARRLADELARKKKYEDFQKIIALEQPEVFLFYPKEVYLVNKRITNIDLRNINGIEQRFDTLPEWAFQ